MKLMSLEMKNFKGLCGKIDFHKDVTAVIGYSAASGKTALVEALLLLRRIMAGVTYEKSSDLVAEGTELTAEFETSCGKLTYSVRFGIEGGCNGNVWGDCNDKETVIRNERVTIGSKKIEADGSVYMGYPILPKGVTKWKFGTLRKKLLEPECVNMMVAHRKGVSYILSRYLTEKAPKGPESEVLCQAASAIAEVRNFTQARIALGNRTLQSPLLKVPGQPHWRFIHASNDDTHGSVLANEDVLGLQEEIKKVNPILEHTVGASLAVTCVPWDPAQQVVHAITVTSNRHEMPLEKCPPSLAAMVRLVWYLVSPFKGETVIIDDLDLGLPEDLFRDITACLAGREVSGQVIFTCRSLAPLDLCDEGRLDIKSIRTTGTLDPDSAFHTPCFSSDSGTSFRLQHRRWWTDNDGKELKELLTAGEK